MPAIVKPQLGFAYSHSDGEENCKAFVDDVELIPNKVGWQPVWLDPLLPLDPSLVECLKCSVPMPLLLQLYTPDDDQADAFHRVLYVFCCKKGSCQSIRCFRSQLPEINATYNHGDGRLVVDSKQLQHLYCVLCGLKGRLQCSECKTVRYCSKQHAIVHWKTGRHSEHCTSHNELSMNSKQGLSADLQRARKEILFPLLDIDSEEEPSVTPQVDPLLLNTVLEQDPSDALDLNEDCEETAVDVDKPFLKFQKRVSVAPDQILRYCRIAVPSQLNEFAQPLAVNSNMGSMLEAVPPCDICKSHRSFECQIMPQLLNHLELQPLNRDSLDWGSIYIFSCPKNCSPASNIHLPYMEEYAVIQQFDSNGLGDSLPSLAKVNAKNVMRTPLK